MTDLRICDSDERLGRPAGTAQTDVLDLVEQRAVADPQDPGGLHAIPGRLIAHRRDRIASGLPSGPAGDVLQRNRGQAGSRDGGAAAIRAGRSDRKGDLLEMWIAEDDHSLHDVLE